MLKIKDNVDLKELEKYGFCMRENCVYDFYMKEIKDNTSFKIIVKPITKKIIIDTSANYINNLDTVYDLIKANLIEKVEE